MKSSRRTSGESMVRNEDPGETRARGTGLASRIGWFAIGFLLLAGATVFAYLQSPRSDPYSPPRPGGLDWWASPVESNAFARLYLIDSDLNDIFALSDARDLWAVGSGGAIVHSADGGRTWERQQVRWSVTPGDGDQAPAAPALKSVSSLEIVSRAYAAKPGSPKIREPPPGSAGMPSRSASPAGPVALRAIFFADRHRGWAVGEGGAILVTSNGGGLWEPQRSPTTATLRSIVFESGGTIGWAAGNADSLLRTDDGGKTWIPMQVVSAGEIVVVVPRQGDARTPRPRTTIKPEQSSIDWVPFVVRADVEPIASAHILTATPVGWAVAESGVFETSDGGLTWRPRDDSFPIRPRAVRFLEGGRQGWVVGEGGAIAATGDGGRTWTMLSRGPQGKFLAAQTRPGGEDVLAICESGDVFASRNGGKTWRHLAPRAPARLRTASFTSDGSLALAAGFDDALYAFESASSAWRGADEFRTGLPGPPVSIGMSSAQGPGLATLADGSLYGSPDGRAWSPLPRPPRALRFIALYLPDTGFGLDGDHFSWRTTDGGRTWSARGDKEPPIVSMHFTPDGTRGWDMDRYGTVYATVDGGTTWTNPIGHRAWPAPWYWLVVVLLIAVTTVPALIRPQLVRDPETSISSIMVSDSPLRPADPDLLHLGDTARAVARFLANRNTQPPLTLSINGPWGSGKSSLMRLIQSELKEYRFPTVWFNAWHHQTEEHLLGSLMESIRVQAIPSVFSVEGLFFKCRLLRRRGLRNLWPAMLILFAFAGLFHYFILDPAHLQSALRVVNGLIQLKIEGGAGGGGKLLGALVALLGPLYILREVSSAFGSRSAGLGALAFGGVRLGRFPARLGFRERFARAYGEITEAMGPRRLTLFIDDLDRCQPKNTMNILEAVNLLVSSGDCFVILGMDAAVVQRSVEIGFQVIKDLPQAVGGQDGSGLGPAEQYLEKMFNIEVPVPRPSGEASERLLVGNGEPGAPREPGTLLQRMTQLLLKGGTLAMEGVSALAPIIVFAAIALIGYQYVPGWMRALDRALAEAVVTDSSEKGAPGRLAGDTGPKPDTGPAENPLEIPETPVAPATSPAGDGTVTRPREHPVPWTFAAGTGGALLLAGVALFAVRYRPLERDSPAFRQALEIWHPVLYAAGSTPRRIKRFLNRVRYLAMSQRPKPGTPTLRHRIRWWLGLAARPPEPRADGGEDTIPIPDNVLVALCAIRHLRLEWLASDELWRDPARFLTDPARAMTTDRQSQRLAEIRSWGTLEPYRDAFTRMTTSLHVR